MHNALDTYMLCGSICLVSSMRWYTVLESMKGKSSTHGQANTQFFFSFRFFSLTCFFFLFPSKPVTCWKTTSALTVDLPSPCLCSFFLEHNFFLRKNFSILQGFNQKKKLYVYSCVGAATVGISIINNA